MILGLLSLLSWVILTSLTPTVIKLAVQETPPITLSFLRFFIATVIILPIYLRQHKKLTKKQLIPLIGITVLGSGVNSAFYAYGIQSTSVILAQVLYATAPILIAFFAFFFHGERLTKLQLFGAILGFIGVVILLSGSLQTKDISAIATPLGSLLVICSVLAYSLFMFFSKKLFVQHSIVTVLFFSFLSGAVILFPVMFVEISLLQYNPFHITLVKVQELLFLGFVASVIAYFFFQFGIKRTSPFIASLVFYISPVAVTIPAIVFLHEKITLPLVIGAVFTFLGVFFAVVFAHIKKRAKAMLQ